MSFDIRLNNGDVVMNARGDLDKITDSDKLAQDVIKLLNTTLGSDPLNPSYGSPLTISSVGTVPDVNSIVTYTQQAITRALEKLIRLQDVQRTYQTVTDAETIVDFNTPLVEQDPQDPRQFNVAVDAISRDLTPITLVFVVRV